MSEITIPDRGELLLDNLELNSPTQVNRSIWTGRRKVVGLAGAESWSGRVSIAGIATENDEKPWRAFLYSLRGPENHFRWYLPCNKHIGLKPTVAAGAGNGYTLPLQGMQPNTRILRAGSFITVPLPSGHSRGVCLTADLVTDGAGAATAEVSPSLNETPTVGVQVETTDPFIPMAPSEGNMNLALVGGVSGTSFSVEEAV